MTYSLDDILDRFAERLGRIQLQLDESRRRNFELKTELVATQTAYRETLADLVSGIERWSSGGGGIPPVLAGDYEVARCLLGEAGLDEPSEKPPREPEVLGQLLGAIEPFVRTARGIPFNWPAQCVLTFDELPSGTRRLNTLKEDEGDRSPTIADWRRLRDLVDVLTPRKT